MAGPLCDSTLAVAIDSQMISDASAGDLGSVLDPVVLIALVVGTLTTVLNLMAIATLPARESLHSCWRAILLEALK